MKGDLSSCDNYRIISLVLHANKVLLRAFLNRIEKKTEEELSGEQDGSRTYTCRGASNQITNLQILVAKTKEHILFL